MKTVELISGNPSYRYGGVLLTRKKPRATVSDDTAEAMIALGKVSEVTEEAAAETAAAVSDGDTGTTIVSATSATAEEDAVEEEVLKKVLAEVGAAKTKDALVTLAKKYGVDVSACKSNESRRAAILAAFE